jgi:hypothetical protein
MTASELMRFTALNPSYGVFEAREGYRTLVVSLVVRKCNFRLSGAVVDLPSRRRRKRTSIGLDGDPKLIEPRSKPASAPAPRLVIYEEGVWMMGGGVIAVSSKVICGAQLNRSSLKAGGEIAFPRNVDRWSDDRTAD